MIEESKLKKLINLSWMESGVGEYLSREDFANNSIMETKRWQCAKEGLVMKSYDEELECLEYRLKIPCLEKDSDLSHEEEEQIRKDGLAIRETLAQKNRESIKSWKKKETWMMADARIPRITISPDTSEVEIVIDDVAEYAENSVRIVKVNMLLKEIQQYQIIEIEDGVIITTDNQKKHLNLSYNFEEGAIQDDYYEIYQDGYFTLLILIPWMKGGCIQVDYKKMEIVKEIKDFPAEIGTQG